MSAYELSRQENIRRNQALIKDLGLEPTSTAATPKSKPPPRKKQKLATAATPAAATRASARIASAPKPEYRSPSPSPSSLRGGRKSNPKRHRSRAVTTTTTASAAASSPSPSPAADTADLVAGWTAWEAVAPPATRTESGVLRFESHPSFTPNRTPAEVLREGAFGGCYFRPYYSKTLGVTIRDDWEELPSEWVEGLDVSRFLVGGEKGAYDAEANKYGVKAGQSLEDWEKAGWIDHRFDARGWFQWYVRFYLGRRCEDDERQVGRWERCVGKRGRWRRALLKQYLTRGVRSVMDEDGMDGGAGGEVSPIVSQTCLQWAWEVRQDELDEVWHHGL